MLFNVFIWVSGQPPKADNEFLQIIPDSGKGTRGRYIGGGRDTSAPTEVRIILLITIIKEPGSDDDCYRFDDNVLRLYYTTCPARSFFH